MNENSGVGAVARIVLLLFFLPCVVGAQETTLPLWQKGTWDIGPFVTGATGEELTDSFTEAQLFSAAVYFGRVMTGEFGRGWRLANLEYGFDVIPIFVQTGTPTIHGGGFDPVILRFNSGHRFGRVVPYIELGGGGIATTSNFPPGKSGRSTSDFNFTAHGGGGIHIITARRQSLDIGCKWFHASNANLASFNPEFNGIQFSLGYHFFK
jgi:hypothetical protein